MSRKSRGINAERALIKLFWENGWAAIRSAGSGSMQYPSPDILVGKNGRRLAIECKLTTETKKYLPLEEIKQLQYFARVFGAEAWIAIKFLRKKWYFLNIEDLQITGKNYAVDENLADLKGLSFEEVIN
jgi:Holliday junction resolvase